jgi:hypothetical protein
MVCSQRSVDLWGLTMSYSLKTVEAFAAPRKTANGKLSAGPATRSILCPYPLAPDVCRV